MKILKPENFNFFFGYSGMRRCGFTLYKQDLTKNLRKVCEIFSFFRQRIQCKDGPEIEKKSKKRK